MWYIDKVYRRDYYGDVESDVPFAFYEYYHYTTNRISVSLRESRSGVKVGPLYYETYEDLIKELSKYNPAGFVDGRKPDGTKISAGLFVRFDELSLRFLDNVKSITQIVDCDNNLLSHIMSLQQQFIFWGRDFELVEWVSGQFVCSLFQMACFVRDSWYEDKLYLRAGPQNKCIGICIDFKDANKARLMLVKAACTGYNPVRDHIESAMAFT